LAAALVLELPLVLGILAWRQPVGQRQWTWVRLGAVALGVNVLTAGFAPTLAADLAFTPPVLMHLAVWAAVSFVEGLILGHWGKVGFAWAFPLAGAANALTALAWAFL
jgi:hypothetical protein